jgi:protein subunit release factor B
VEKTLLFSLTKKDFEMQTFRSGGKGGQNQNKVNTGVRFIHRASGAVGEGRDSRTQLENKKNAFMRMAGTPKFQAWLKLEIARQLGKEAEVKQKVERLMSPENLKVEYLGEEQ